MFASGNRYEGTWENGRIHGHGAVPMFAPRRSFCIFCTAIADPSGNQGTLTYSNKDQYDGDWFKSYSLFCLSGYKAARDCAQSCAGLMMLPFIWLLGMMARCMGEAPIAMWQTWLIRDSPIPPTLRHLYPAVQLRQKAMCIRANGGMTSDTERA